MENVDSLPTSVDLLAPDSPALKVLNTRAKPPQVHYHSVIGVTQDNTAIVERLLAGAPLHEEGDGVVPVSSARIDTADSEIIVPADHSHVHQHPLTVLEVRRILLENAGIERGR